MSAEVAVRPPGPHPIMLRDPASLSLADWQQICDYLSMSDIVPDSLIGKPANIFLVIQMGLELGLPWVRAIQTIYSPAKGRTGILGTLLVKNIREAGHKIRWEEFEDGCTCRIWRKDEPDEPYEATFTKADAVTARLTDKENYKRYAKRMYRWRATSDCAGFACPEVSLGFAVIEAMDEAPEQVQLRPQTPAAGPGLAATGDPSQALADLEAEIAQRRAATGQHMDRWQAGVETHPGEPGDGGVSEGGGERVDPEFAQQVSEAMDANDGLMTALATDTPPEPTGPADKATRDRLSAVLTQMGWTKRHMPDILRMFSHYCGREIGSVMSMRAGEVINLTAALVELKKDTHEDGWIVALADKSAEWAEKWAETDPLGYEAYAGEGGHL